MTRSLHEVLSPAKRQRIRRLRIAASCILLGVLSAMTALFFGARVGAADLDGKMNRASDDGTSATRLPRELGRVAWLRDFDAAAATSRKTDKPIFVLFQEVPGCQTCVDFGENVLSHPLLIEAIEDEFVPVAILNNAGGQDRATLERFGEPAWNNPVVRFVDAEGHDLIPRKDRVWLRGEVATRMIRALEAANRSVPAYLRQLRDEWTAASTDRATLSMFCFWQGEACLGGTAGVLSTRTGHLGGHEVVEVRFDPDRIAYGELLRTAQRAGCADAVFAHDQDQLAIARVIYGDAARYAPARTRDARRRDQKFHLKRFDALESLSLTPAQQTRVNHAVWEKRDPTGLLSPRQREQLHQSVSD